MRHLTPSTPCRQLAGDSGRSPWRTPVRNPVACATFLCLLAACSAPDDGRMQDTAPSAAPARGQAAGNGPAPAAQGDGAAADAPAAPAPIAEMRTEPFDGATIPTRFHGLYAAQGACESSGETSRLLIAADAVQFHESRGRVLRARGEGDALVVTLALAGEGETWERDYRFGLADGGQGLVDADSGLVRLRCAKAG